MLSRIGLFSWRARSSASVPHGYQSTGLFACCRRYGLVSLARRLGIVSKRTERQFWHAGPTPKLYRLASQEIARERPDVEWFRSGLALPPRRNSVPASRPHGG